ncbi:riboflavin synthase [candidate division KSB1 bacterium]|nr:riboflavin synthase [candidate division KSB1 bacterium]
MFTGLIEEIGLIKERSPIREGFRFTIAAQKVLEDLKVGDSISVDGVCLTVTNLFGAGFQAEVVGETLRKTTLQYVYVGDRVNLERPVKLTDRLGGHWVQGHVDGIGRLVSVRAKGESLWIKIEIPSELMVYVVPQGSIAVDGVSLTIAGIESRLLGVFLVPHTLKATTLGLKKAGDRVNIETDVVGKYVQGFLSGSQKELTKKWIFERGFDLSNQT